MELQQPNLPPEQQKFPQQSKQPPKKKRKRNNRKKKKNPTSDLPFTSKFQDNSAIRGLQNWLQSPDFKQTNPPSVPLSAQYPSGVFPAGQIIQYQGQNSYRTTNQQLRERQRMHTLDYQQMRKGAQCHRQVRRWAQSALRPGTQLNAFCQELESYTRLLLENDSVEAGVGFPTGVSINNCAAHYSPNPGDRVVVDYQDVIKVDFGTHVGGRIIDCAFTVAFDPKYDNLLAAPRAATNEGLKQAGVDARLGEIGEAIQEVMESYEIELNGRNYHVRAVKNLNGHSIQPYHIHAGKYVPTVKSNDQNRMEEGEVYAIETFGSTGKGFVRDDGECSHYMIDFDMFGKPVALRDNKAKALLRHIERKYGSLPWCRRFLARDGQTKHILPLKSLVNAEVVAAYPPLCDVEGSYVAQYEHTVLIKPTCKEIISRGDDFQLRVRI